MKIIFATRDPNTNTIIVTLELVAGTTVPFSYYLQGNATIPDATNGDIEALIVEYYNSLSAADKSIWDTVASTVTVANTALPGTSTSSTVSPQTITRRQFFEQLVVDNIISEADALSAAGGTLPASILSIIGQLPVANQFSAKMALISSPYFYSDSSITTSICAAYGWTATQLNTFWAAAALL